MPDSPSSGEPAMYQMRFSLSVLDHRGLNLYSNIPAVISEVVANSWDADATLVSIDIDKVNGQITVTDNGVGMRVADLNDRFLFVGYRRRDTGPQGHRQVVVIRDCGDRTCGDRQGW